MATGGMQQGSKVWWEATHESIYKDKTIEEITWDQFRDTFYEQYFSETVRSAKKIEFLSLRQTEDMSVADYQARFLMLERFAHSSATTERERASQFVAGLHLAIRSVVSTFYYATLAEAVMRALQNERIHVFFHQERALGLGRGRARARNHQQGPQPQRQRTDARVAVFEGQLDRFPRQTDSFQDQRQPLEQQQRHPPAHTVRGDTQESVGGALAIGRVRVQQQLSDQYWDGTI